MLLIRPNEQIGPEERDAAATVGGTNILRACPRSQAVRWALKDSPVLRLIYIDATTADGFYLQPHNRSLPRRHTPESLSAGAFSFPMFLTIGSNTISGCFLMLPYVYPIKASFIGGGANYYKT